MKSFFRNKGPFLINEILKKTLFSEKIKLKKKVLNVSNLLDAQKGDIIFFDNLKYLDDLKNSKASFCFVKKNYVKYLDKNTMPIISSNPLLDFILVCSLFYPEASTDNFTFKQNVKFKKLNKKGTFVDKSVKVGKNLKIGFNTVIKKNVIIGDNVTIGSNCVISNSMIGNNVIINDGSVIGKIGYGFKFINGKFIFIPHIGCVILNDNAYIGSNCTIDRGSFSNTIVGKSTMVDNQVHIAHNVKIGNFCFIAGQAGVAGSSIIGDNCMIGGQSGISGHLMIGSNVHIGGNSGVLKNIEDNKKVMGYPAVDIKKFLKRSINDR